MATVYGGECTRSYRWGTGRTRARLTYSTSEASNGTDFSITLTGHMQSVSPYNMALYGTSVTVGHNGGGGTKSASKTATGIVNYQQWVGGATGTWKFKRGDKAYKVTIWCKYAGRLVNDHGAHNNYGTVTATVTVPARKYTAPAAPSGCSASRTSDTRAKVTWKNGATTSSTPRKNVKVERKTDDGKWVQVQSLSSGATSYTDNGISANHRYAYHVRSYGNGGHSGYAASGYIYTTPAKPKSVGISKVGAASIRVSVDGSNAKWATSWELQYDIGGSGWRDAGSYSSFPVTQNPGAGVVKYRARSVRGSLASAWVESDEITTIARPSAPTVDRWDPVTAVGGPLAVTWKPNHPDRSDQTSAEVAYAVGSSEETVVVVEGAGTSLPLPESAIESPGAVSARVRTHGAHDEWGDWSEPVSTQLAIPPQLSITSPAVDGEVILKLPLRVEWDVVDETGVTQQEIELLSEDGTVLHTGRVVSFARDYELNPETYRLSNETSYSVRVRVTGGSTLEAVSVRDFTVDFNPPVDPIVTVTLDKATLSQEIIVEGGVPSETHPQAVSFDVERVEGDGTRWLVEGGLSDGGVCVDPLPPLNTPYRYEVTATSEEGTQATTSVDAMVVSMFPAISAGDAASVRLPVGYDFEFSMSPSRSREFYHFADGGLAGGLPLEYELTSRNVDMSASWTLVDRESYRMSLAFARDHGTAWLRDLDGGRHRVAFDLSFTRPSTGIRRWEVSASMTEIWWMEAWDG